MQYIKIAPTMALDFKQAQPSDFSQAMEIMAAAASWLLDKGIDQWPSPPPAHWQQRMTAKIDQGAIYTLGIGNNRFGIVGLTWVDSYWPDDGQAGYVHQMAVHPVMHGQNLGGMILFWAQQQVKKKGRQFVRLDCMASNGRLRQYYEEHGFLFRGRLTDHDYVAALYEKDVTELP